MPNTDDVRRAERDGRLAQLEQIAGRVSRMTRARDRQPDYLRAIADVLDVLAHATAQLEELSKK